MTFPAAASAPTPTPPCGAPSGNNPSAPQIDAVRRAERFNCSKCRDTGEYTVTLWGVRDSAAGRYEQEDRPCSCPLGVAAQDEGAN